MGFFSKTCSKTNLPVIHHGYGDDWHCKFPEFYEVVAIYPDGKKVVGAYDGYGRVDGVSICPEGYNHNLWNKVKFVLKRHYMDESYNDLGPSHDEIAQGHFMDEGFIVYCKTEKPLGFKNYKEYEREFKKRAGW